MDPRPQRYLTTLPGIGGQIKVRPEDFIVDEIPLYEPADAGEHLYLRVQKSSVSHGELMSCVRRHFDVPMRAIGYAGMKDKHAITSQTISIHLPHGDPPSVEIPHERILIQWATRHRNKIRRGHLRGNRFAIRIRDVEPHRAPAAMRVLRSLEHTGVPAYFGEQRFGYRVNNHVLGRMLLAEDWQGAVDELLGTGGTEFPDYQLSRREAYDEGEFGAAAAAWTTADRAERIACTALDRGATPQDAIAAIGKTTLAFWASSLASGVFNRLLDERIDDQALATLRDGDLAWKHDSRAVFPVTPDMLGDEELARRLEQMEISPSGPVWGAKMTEAEGDIAIAERNALAAFGVDHAWLGSRRYRPEGARRPFRAPVRNADVEGGFDDHGTFVRIAFDLDRGMYATVVAREIMKTE